MNNITAVTKSPLSAGADADLPSSGGGAREGPRGNGAAASEGTEAAGDIPGGVDVSGEWLPWSGAGDGAGAGDACLGAITKTMIFLPLLQFSEFPLMKKKRPEWLRLKVDESPLFFRVRMGLFVLHVL